VHLGQRCWKKAPLKLPTDGARIVPSIPRGIRVCVGGGSLGTRAALLARAKGDRTLVIDIDARCRAQSHADLVIEDSDLFLASAPGSICLLIADGTRALLNILKEWVPDEVVAASRGHLAAHLAVEHVRQRGKDLRPSTELVPSVVNALPSGSVIISDPNQAVVVTSFMPLSQQCIDGCQQAFVCPVTSRKLPVPMHTAIFHGLEGKVDLSLLLRTSHSEDVAYVSGRELVTMLSSLDQMDTGDTCAIATACGCHGFINLFQLFDDG
jgi:hypothetical protein